MLNCVASEAAMINCHGRLLAFELLMDGWPLSSLCQGRLWRIGATKSGVHGAVRIVHLRAYVRITQFQVLNTQQMVF